MTTSDKWQVIKSKKETLNAEDFIKTLPIRKTEDCQRCWVQGIREGWQASEQNRDLLYSGLMKIIEENFGRFSDGCEVDDELGHVTFIGGVTSFCEDIEKEFKKINGVLNPKEINMTTIKALIEKEIFDDPEYCDRDFQTKKYKKCLNLSFGGCMGFPDYALKNSGLQIDKDSKCYIKCDQCKEVWKRCHQNKETRIFLSEEKIKKAVVLINDSEISLRIACSLGLKMTALDLISKVIPNLEKALEILQQQTGKETQ